MNLWYLRKLTSKSLKAYWIAQNFELCKQRMQTNIKLQWKQKGSHKSKPNPIREDNYKINPSPGFQVINCLSYYILYLSFGSNDFLRASFSILGLLEAHLHVNWEVLREYYCNDIEVETNWLCKGGCIVDRILGERVKLAKLWKQCWSY